MPSHSGPATLFRRSLLLATALATATNLNLRAAPPDNDLFAQATVIPGSVTSTNLQFRTDDSGVEPGEPLAGAVPATRSVWWKWTPTEPGLVRFKVAGPFGGLPVDVFIGNDLSHLTRVAHNDSRTLYPPLEGMVPLQALGGDTYFIRVDDRRQDGSQTYPIFPFEPVPTVRTNLTLTLEPLGTALPGLFMLSTGAGMPGPGGQVQWTIFGRVRKPDGVSLASGPQYLAQFYAGKALTTLQPVGPVIMPHPGASAGDASLEGVVSAGLSHLDEILAGTEVLLQLRAWEVSGGHTYETARANRGAFGHSAMLKVIAGSEETGPTVLTEIRDVVLSQPLANFQPGLLTLDTPGDNPTWKLTGPAGFLYALETSTLDGVWNPLLVITNTTGTATFADPRPEPGPINLYRTRIID